MVALSAMCGNTIASVFRVPYEVIKQRMQYGLHTSTFAAIKHSFATEGPLGLFRSGKLASQVLLILPLLLLPLLIYYSTPVAPQKASF